MAKFITFDTECVWREDWHQAHRAMDPRTSRRAIAVREIMAISAYAFEFDADGRLLVDDLRTWTWRDWGDEDAIVEQFFDFVRARPDAALVGYGSIAMDVPVLMMAAMTHGLQLPQQLRDSGPVWNRKHVDLGLKLKGRGKTWTHLSQLAIRQGIPLALVSAKSDVPLPSTPEQWTSLADHVALDTLLLALVWSAWLVADATPCLRYAPAAIAHIAAFRRRMPAHQLETVLAQHQRELEEQLRECIAP